MLVLHEDDESSEKIEKFARSSYPWIVAVHMVSEGVDIPRLRVGAYASNYLTTMYFRQFVGRFVRMQRGIDGDQRAYVYLPADPDVLAMAARIKQDVLGWLKEKSDREAPPRTVPSPSIYEGLGASAAPGPALHGDDPSLFAPAPGEGEETWTLDDFERESANRAKKAAPLVADEKRKLRRKIAGMASSVARNAGIDVKRVHSTLNSRLGKTVGTTDEDGLRRRVERLSEWLKTGRYDGMR